MKPHDFDRLRVDEKYKTILRTNIGNRDWFDMIVHTRFIRKLKELDRRLLLEMESR
jgi:hypothetical protein